MKKTKILSLLLCLSLFCALIVPGTRAYADNEPDSGMKISKTAAANADGSYTIMLEAFATGSTVITEQKTDIPTDIVLVIDQSGSMADDIGQVQYTAYTGNNTQNKSNYEKRHNGGSANLWHKLPDGSYVSVSVTLQQTITYNKITKGRNDNGSSGYTNYWENRNNLYTYVNGEIKKVVYTRERDWFWENWNCKYALEDGTILNQNNEGSDHSPTFQNTDDGYLYLAVANENQNVYTYTYADTSGTTQTIGTSTGANTKFEPAFYQRSTTTSGGGSRLNALKSAANAFANAVAAKAAGADGDISTPADNVNHRIAVVGFASGQYHNGTNYNYGNTEVFVGSNQYKYGSAAQGQYGNAFQDMNTSTGVGNVSASIGTLSADGGTLTNLGLEMGNGIFGANPIAEGEKRYRVVIVFSDGVPGWSGYDSNTATSAITQAETAKNTYGATVYSIGIFPGADATSAGNQNGNETEKANWFMQQVSSNNGTPQSPSCYLSAADAGTLNSIFQQISDQIETGGTTSTLTSDAVVKDIISPQFTLPAGTTAANITVETYACTGKNANDDYTWSNNNSTMGATASISGDQVNVTGFNFSENYVGTVTENGNMTYRGHKLVISFKVQPKAGFLGGNEVYTNTSAGIYENNTAENPLLTFDRPTVNVPIQDVTVTAKDKNVYLKGEVTADQLKDGSEISVGNVTLDLTKENYGLESWQTEYVDITVTVKDKDGNVISDKLDNLTEDTTYTVEVTVSPKNEGTSTAAKGDAATAKTGSSEKNIYVFKPELTFKDSTAYYGETVPANNDYSSNYVANSEKWKNGGKYSTDDGVQMIGTKPTLDITYTPDESKLDGGKYTKQDVPVAATVKIGTENVNEHTTFVHQDCASDCGWETPTTPGAPAFLIHIKTCTLTITKSGAAGSGEGFIFDVTGAKNLTVSVQDNGTVKITGLPIGDYTVTEQGGWSWRYTASSTGTATLGKDNPNGSVTMNNTRTDNTLLDGSAYAQNNSAAYTAPVTK